MAKIPGQRRPGQTGGERWHNTNRETWRNAGKQKRGCALTLIMGTAIILAGSTYAATQVFA